jgi:hypothetical protein
MEPFDAAWREPDHPVRIGQVSAALLEQRIRVRDAHQRRDANSPALVAQLPAALQGCDPLTAYRTRHRHRAD